MLKKFMSLVSALLPRSQANVESDEDKKIRLKAERAAYHKNYAAANRDKGRQASNRWAAKNKDKIEAANKKWIAAHVGYQKNYYAANRERCKQEQKRWREENPGYHKEWLAEQSEEYRLGVKKAHAARLRSWRAENPDKWKAYRVKNKERLDEANKKWRQQNKDKVLAAAKRRYKENREAVLDKAKAFYELNKDKIKARIYAQRAAKRAQAKPTK